MARQVVVKGNYVLCAGDVLIGICGVAPHLGTQCGVSRLLLFVSLIASNNTCRRPTLMINLLKIFLSERHKLFLSFRSYQQNNSFMASNKLLNSYLPKSQIAVNKTFGIETLATHQMWTDVGRGNRGILN